MQKRSSKVKNLVLPSMISLTIQLLLHIDMESKYLIKFAMIYKAFAMAIFAIFEILDLISLSKISSAFST